MYFEASWHGLKQGGLGRGAATPHLQTQCSHDGFQNKPYALKQARGLGGRGVRSPPPPVCKQNARMMGFENTVLKQACTAQKSTGVGVCLVLSSLSSSSSLLLLLSLLLLPLLFNFSFFAFVFDFLLSYVFYVFCRLSFVSFRFSILVGVLIC